MLVYFSLFMGFFSCNSFNTIAMAAVEIDIYRLLLEFSSLFLGISLVTIRGLRVSRIKIVLREIINMVTCFFLLPFRDICFIFMAIMHTKFCFGNTCFVSNCIASWFKGRPCVKMFSERSPFAEIVRKKNVWNLSLSKLVLTLHLTTVPSQQEATTQQMKRWQQVRA